MLRGYQQMIQAATRCPDEDAAEIEEFMRLEYSTLDHLDADTFKREAQISYEALKLFRSTPNPLLQT